MNTKNIIAGKVSGQGDSHMYATNPKTKEKLEGAFVEATDAEIDRCRDRRSGRTGFYGLANFQKYKWCRQSKTTSKDR